MKPINKHNKINDSIKNIILPLIREIDVAYEDKLHTKVRHPLFLSLYKNLSENIEEQIRNDLTNGI